MTTSLPHLPNELLMHIIDYIPASHLSVFLLVCRYTHQLVSGKAYRKTIFPDTLPLADIMNFCQRHGSSLVTIKLPQGKRYSDTFYMLLFQLCPQLNFLQSSMTPKQLIRFLLRTQYPLTCFMMTQQSSSSPPSCQQQQQHHHHHHPRRLYQQQQQRFLPYGVSDGLDELIQVTQDLYNVTKLTCCSSIFLFPNHPIPDSTLTHISHYFHHPGALRNAILPTFGPDLLSLTLNTYDVLTVSVAQMIALKCPRLRYLHIPQIKAEGLWVLLHRCNTLVAIVVGGGEDGDRNGDENESAANYYNNNDDDNEDGVRVAVMRQENDGGDWEANDDDANDDLGVGNIRWINQENKKAVATVATHKRVWCIHEQQPHSSHSRRLSWHIGILPKR